MVKLNRVGASNKYKMRIESYQLFSQLLEGYLNEASTSLNLILDNPGGKQVVTHLHTDMGLAHDQDYRQVEKISWSELKDARRGAWVIIKGTTGTFASTTVCCIHRTIKTHQRDLNTIHLVHFCLK